MHNAADKEGVEFLEKKVKNERDQELEDLREILRTPQGLRFFKNFIKKGKIFETNFTGNSRSFFLDGRKNLALEVFNDIREAAPNRVLELITVNEE